MIDPDCLEYKVQQYLQYSSWYFQQKTNTPPPPANLDLSLKTDNNITAGSIWMIKNATSLYNWIDLYRNDVMKTTRFDKLIGLGKDDLDFIESLRWCGHLNAINSKNVDNNIPDLKDYLNRIFILIPHNITENNEITKDRHERLVNYFCEEVIHNTAVSLYECLCRTNMYPNLMEFTAKCVGNAVSNGSVSNYQTLKIVTVVISNIRDQWLLTFGLTLKRNYALSFFNKITTGFDVKEKMIWKKVKHNTEVVSMIKRKNPTVPIIEFTYDQKKSSAKPKIITWNNIPPVNQKEIEKILSGSENVSKENLCLCRIVLQVKTVFSDKEKNVVTEKTNLFVPDIMSVMDNHVSTRDKDIKVEDDTKWKQYFDVSELVNQYAEELLPDCLFKYESEDERDNLPQSNTYKAAYKQSEDQWLAFQESIDSYYQNKKENSEIVAQDFGYHSFN